MDCKPGKEFKIFLFSYFVLTQKRGAKFICRLSSVGTKIGLMGRRCSRSSRNGWGGTLRSEASGLVAGLRPMFFWLRG